MGKRDSVKAWTCLLSAGRRLAMRRASVMQPRFQGWTERIGFQEKMWCGCVAIGSVLARTVWTCLRVDRCLLSGFLLASPINSIRHMSTCLCKYSVTGVDFCL